MGECVSGEVYIYLHMGFMLCEIHVSVVASETVCMGCDEMS